MLKKFSEGLVFGFGIVVALGLLFGAVYAVGFHTADEVLSGTFSGDYTFTGSVSGVIPSGAVLAFNTSSCPSGWSAYTSANGRTLVGEGTVQSRTFTLGENGGDIEAEIDLIVANHNANTALGNDTYLASTAIDTSDGSTSAMYRTQSGTTNTVSILGGGNGTDGNLQPYHVVTYCIKD